VILDSLILPGSYDQALETMPRIVCEVFDHDVIGGNDFLGRFTATAHVRTKHSPSPAVLKWFDLVRAGEPRGEILACFELLPAEDCPAFPLPKVNKVPEEYTKKRVVGAAISKNLPLMLFLETCKIAGRHPS